MNKPLQLFSNRDPYPKGHCHLSSKFCIPNSVLQNQDLNSKFQLFLGFCSMSGSCTQSFLLPSFPRLSRYNSGSPHFDDFKLYDSSRLFINGRKGLAQTCLSNKWRPKSSQGPCLVCPLPFLSLNYCSYHFLCNPIMSPVIASNSWP